MDAGLAAIGGALAGAFATLGASFLSTWTARATVRATVRAEHQRELRTPRRDAYRKLVEACGDMDSAARKLCVTLDRNIKERTRWDDVENANAMLAFHDAVKAACLDTVFLGPTFVNEAAWKLAGLSRQIEVRVASLYSLLPAEQLPDDFSDMRDLVQDEDLSGYVERMETLQMRVQAGCKDLSAAIFKFVETSQRALEVTGVE